MLQVWRNDESMDEEFAFDVGDRRGVGDANILVAAVEFERFTRREARGGGRNIERPIGRRCGDGVVERRGGGGRAPEGSSSAGVTDVRPIAAESRMRRRESALTAKWRLRTFIPRTSTQG